LTYAYVGENPVSGFDPLGLQRAPARPGIPGYYPPLIPPTPADQQYAQARDATAIAIDDAVSNAIDAIVNAAKAAAQAVHDACSTNAEDARCKKVYKDCANQCADTFADNPEQLPGTGRDYASRTRRCIAECVKAAGCSPSKVP